MKRILPLAWLIAMAYISAVPGFLLMITLRLCKWNRLSRR